MLLSLIPPDDLTAFRSYLLTEEKSRHTVEKYLRDVERFFLFAKASSNEAPSGRERAQSLASPPEICAEENRSPSPLPVITKETLLRYKESLAGSYAVSSANSMLASVNVYLKFLGRADLCIRPFKVQRQIFRREEKELTRAEYDRLLAAALKKGNRRLYLLMQTICTTGIRVSELSLITVASLSTGVAEVQNKGKQRRVYLPKSLCKMLREYCKEEKILRGAVFVTKSGIPLDRSNIWSDMKKLCKAAKVDPEKVFPHNLRHLFARTYYSMQKDIVRLADLLGHASVNTTRLYTQETGETHRRQIERLGLLRC